MFAALPMMAYEGWLGKYPGIKVGEDFKGYTKQALPQIEWVGYRCRVELITNN